MRLNTLFSTFFGRRTGVGFKFMSNAVELDGKTKVSSAVARTGIPVLNHKMIIEIQIQIHKKN